MLFAESMEVGREDREPDFLSVTVLVLWLLCLGVGALGLALPYPRPDPPVRTPPPVQAEMIEVQLTGDPSPPPASLPDPADPVGPPPLLEIAPITPAPARLAVAEPRPPAPLALPAERPARFVEPWTPAPASAGTGTGATGAPAPTAAAQPLTFGQGEGKQPAPAYPRQAVREGQEGTVLVRLSVGESGRVTAVTAVSPCPWPLLNEAALRVVRERWRFPAGGARLYEVSIRFELTK